MGQGKDEPRELSPLACGLWAVAAVLALYTFAIVLLH